MSEGLRDEVISITSIYGDSALLLLSEEPIVYVLRFPGQLDISIRIEFPQDYPESSPRVRGTQSVGENLAKGDGVYLVELIRDVLAEVYTPGAACLFDLIEETESRLQRLGLEQSSRIADQQTAHACGHPQEGTSISHSSFDEARNSNDVGKSPPWTLSDVITEKKSVFVARSAPVSSVNEARQYRAHLLATDKKAAKATHNITAWRIRGENGVQYQDCDDDGETAAGGRVLHLMELMGIWDAMVVVSRWYGGIQLGPDRFRIINQTARDALLKLGFPQATSRDDAKKKGKK